MDYSVKVKQPTPSELASSRHDAVTARDAAAWNFVYLDKRRRSSPRSCVPVELSEQVGFSTYVRRLERRQLALAEPSGGAPATPGGEAERPLGNNTLSRAEIREVLDENTGEIQRLRYDSKRGEYVPEISPEWASINSRAARFSAQSSAAKLLYREVTPRGGQWRVAGCSRRKIAADVAILYSEKIKKAHFGGVMVCGSVWTCPPCAAKVSERRKNEIVVATDFHKSNGGGLYMVTLTTSHKRDDDLGLWLRKFSDARARMRRQRRYRDLLELMGYVGNIRALEVTFGDANGWHPHEHALWLTTKRLTARQVELLCSELFFFVASCLRCCWPACAESEAWGRCSFYGVVC